MRPLQWVRRARKAISERIEHPTEFILTVAYLAAGVVVLAGGIPSSVREVLGDGFHVLWEVLVIVGPLLVIVGTLWGNAWRAAALCAGGAAAITSALAVFTIALQASFGPSVTVMVFTGLTLATLYATGRNARFLWRMERVARREES